MSSASMLVPGQNRSRHSVSPLARPDCGSGVGRVTKELLMRHFHAVDLVEPVVRERLRGPRHASGSSLLACCRPGRDRIPKANKRRVSLFLTALFRLPRPRARSATSSTRPRSSCTAPPRPSAATSSTCASPCSPGPLPPAATTSSGASGSSATSPTPTWWLFSAAAPRGWPRGGCWW